MDEEMLNQKTKTAIDKFLNLDGDTFNRKKRSFNTFLKKLESDYSPEETEDFIQNLTIKTEYDQVLKTAVVVHFQLENSTWDILKSGNEAAIGKILKNWKFFKNIFNNISIDHFVNEILPLLSYKTNVKIIKVISKNLDNNELLSDCLFNKLEEKYGIKIATILLSTCSIQLIKSKCLKYGLNLSSRCLLHIYKKHQTFLDYYFDLMQNRKHKKINFVKYEQVLKHIMQTNLELYWKLNKKYKFSISIGRRRTQKILCDKESVLTHGFTDERLFRKKYVLNAARKVGLHKEFLLKSYPDNLDDYLKFHLGRSYNVTIIYMPRKQLFPLLNELFEEKYKENLKQYLKLMDKNYLKYVTIPEREIILDQLEDKENWLYYYPTSKSIQIFKEKLKSANDPQARRKLIGFLYKTCYENNDECALLDTLKFLYKRYKNDTYALSDIVSNLISWKNYSLFTEDHWEIIDNLTEYLTYSNFYVNEHHFFEHHFVWLVDNDKPFSDLLDKHLKTANEKKCFFSNYCFLKSPRHMKIFIEEIHKRLHGKCDEIYFDFLRLVVNFDKCFPNEINVLDYVYILDMAVERSRFRQTGHAYYFIKQYNKDKSFNKYIKYFNNNSIINWDIVKYCLENCPEELENFENLHKKLCTVKNQWRQFILCPYFVAKHLDAYKKLAIDELRGASDVHGLLLNILSYHKEFLGIIPEFEPLEDGKIQPQTDRIFITKQQSIIKLIPKLHASDRMKLILKFSKGDYLKYALPALYKIAYNSPEISISEFLQTIYKNPVSVRKHALFLGRHLLPKNLYHDFLLSASNLETNLSIRNILLKKSLEYFIENIDIKFFDLFVSNLNKIDKNDRELYDSLLKYEDIPREFIAKYITTLYNNIIDNNDEEIRKKRFQLLHNLPDYVIDDFDIDFMKRCLLDITIGTTNFVNKCLFHTTGSKYDEIHRFIFDLIVDSLKACNLENIASRKNVSNLISNICKESVNCENYKVIEKLYEICKINLPQHRFLTTKLLLDFSILFVRSKKNFDSFAKEINAHLLEFTKMYTPSIIGFYASELKSFLSSSEVDEFEFVVKFFNGNAGDDTTCLVTIAFLPHYVPTEKNAYAKYLPILNILRKVQLPNVIAHLDMYFSTSNY